MAFQVFHESGVLGLLPLPNQTYNVVWSVSLPFYDYLINLSDHDFLEEINSKLQSNKEEDFTRPPTLTSQVSKRVGFHLSTTNLENYFSGQRVVFMGDSAHTIHPMVGQGLNLGIGDARTLAERLADNLRYGLGVSSREALIAFEKEAKLRNYGLQMGVEGLKVLFESPWAEPLREAAAEVVGASAAVREGVYRQANSF